MYDLEKWKNACRRANFLFIEIRSLSIIEKFALGTPEISGIGMGLVPGFSGVPKSPQFTKYLIVGTRIVGMENSASIECGAVLFELFELVI